MEYKKIILFSDLVKQLFSLKRTKATLYMVIVLWLAVGTQMVVNKYFQEEFRISEAFVKANSEEMQSSIEVVAEYKKDFLSETDKRDLILHLAEAIGLIVDEDIEVYREGERSEFAFKKTAKSATSEIKLISVEQEKDSVIKMKHYIIMRLNILQSVESVDKFKSIIVRTLKGLGVSDHQITMQYTGSYSGKLSKEEKNSIASLLVKELHGETALKYDEEDLYTVYAYSGLINEYVVSAGSKVNIQIAITYNELLDKTNVYLATPFLNQSW